MNTDPIPPHVQANMDLSYELTAAYWRPAYKNKAHPSCHAAGMRFANKESADSYWQEYAAAQPPKPEPKPKREPTYEDIIRSWGGTFEGCSEVMPHQQYHRTALAGETKAHG